MPSRISQAQFHCYRCDAPTLHTRAAAEFNHLPHLIASLFLCGLWAPVWLLLAAIHESRKPEPYMCSRCGQPAGRKTPERIAAERSAERAATAKMFDHLPKPEPKPKPPVVLPKIVTDHAPAKPSVPTEPPIPKQPAKAPWRSDS